MADEPVSGDVTQTDFTEVTTALAFIAENSASRSNAVLAANELLAIAIGQCSTELIERARAALKRWGAPRPYVGAIDGDPIERYVLGELTDQEVAAVARASVPEGTKGLFRIAETSPDRDLAEQAANTLITLGARLDGTGEAAARAQRALDEMDARFSGEQPRLRLIQD